MTVHGRWSKLSSVRAVIYIGTSITSTGRRYKQRIHSQTNSQENGVRHPSLIIFTHFVLLEVETPNENFIYGIE